MCVTNNKNFYPTFMLYSPSGMPTFSLCLYQMTHNLLFPCLISLTPLTTLQSSWTPCTALLPHNLSLWHLFFVVSTVFTLGTISLWFPSHTLNIFQNIIYFSINDPANWSILSFSFPWKSQLLLLWSILPSMQFH